MDSLTMWLLSVAILSLLLNILLWFALSRCESKEKSIKYREDRDHWYTSYREIKDEFTSERAIFHTFLPLIRKTGKPFCAADIVPGKRFFNVSMDTKDIPTERRRVVAVMKDGKSRRFVYTLLGMRDDGTTYHTKLGWHTQAELYELIQSDHIMVDSFT